MKQLIVAFLSLGLILGFSFDSFNKQCRGSIEG
ncbi:hypothetical protein LG52_1960 [Geobacillus kaustophilus]|uniref:Uncharacterized protein n=1 Tax=Geobacillus kaustophilus TaxID=1462 RepID=A0A0D8BYZ9_GEOKU|nr:hypothetical protein LG52_1960 [Geobacillus kaustophilus]